MNEIVFGERRGRGQNKPQPSVPFPISFPKTIAFISSGAKTQKKKQYPIPDAASERV